MSSYYDSVAFLATRGAIGTIDAIPFNSEGETVTEPKVAPPIPKQQILHPLLTHIPVSGVIGPFDSLPYEEEQRVAINQLVNTGQLPPQLPNHAIGGVKVKSRVLHNLNQNKSTLTSPQPKKIILSVPNSEVKTDSEAIEANEKKQQLLLKLQGKLLQQIEKLQQNPQINAEAIKVALQQQIQLQNYQQKLINEKAQLEEQQEAPVLKLNLKVKPPKDLEEDDFDEDEDMGESEVYTQEQSFENDQQGFRVEVCQICGRDFKGRKASTHKQQHIRRLHPMAYEPKRGGKKTRVE